MGMYGTLIAVSAARQHELRGGAKLLELLLRRHVQPSEHLLELGKAWQALDLVLSDDGRDPVLGDAVLGRSGPPFGPSLSYGPAKLRSKERVATISAALARVPGDVVAPRLTALFARGVRIYPFGDEAPPPEALARDAVGLAADLERLRTFYRDAAARGDAVLTVVT